MHFRSYADGDQYITRTFPSAAPQETVPILHLTGAASLIHRHEKGLLDILFVSIGTHGEALTDPYPHIAAYRKSLEAETPLHVLVRFFNKEVMYFGCYTLDQLTPRRIHGQQNAFRATLVRAR